MNLYFPLVVILLVIGSVTFVNRESGMDSTWSEDVALGDLDGDGDLDIFLGHRDDASSIAFNDGMGNYAVSGIDLGSDFLIDVVLGDVDGDGDLDAIQAGIQDNRLLLNDGQGTFSYAGEIFAGSSTIRAVALGDVDGDNDLDAAIAARSVGISGTAQRIWLNNGTGVFTLSSSSLGTGAISDVKLGDLDGDGDLDAIQVGSVAHNSAVWENLGNGEYAELQMLSDLTADSVDLGDLDGDGDLDAFVGARNLGAALWLNDGDGEFSAGQFLGNLGPTVLGDLDEDGDLDAFSVNWGADKAWLNQGDATFIFAGQLLGEADSTSAELGDIDGDGDLDAVTSGYNVEPNLWINQ